MLERDFCWRGVYASKMGVIATQQVQYHRPAERISTYTVLGRSGTLRGIEEPSYDEVVYSPACAMLPGADQDAIMAWLTGSGEVVFGSMPEYAFQARLSDAFDVTQLIQGAPNGYRLFTPIFVCQPERRHIFAEEWITATAAVTRHYNPGNITARPVLHVRTEAAAVIALSISGQTHRIILHGSAEDMRIDCATIRATGSPEGGWDMSPSDTAPRIPPGAYDVAVTSTGGPVTAIIEPRYRWV